MGGGYDRYYSECSLGRAVPVAGWGLSIFIYIKITITVAK